MGILSKFFGKQNIETTTTTITVPEVMELQRLRVFIDTLLNCTHYVAKSEFKDELPVYQQTV